ncbi:MAG: hypothetical protein CL583_01795 [Alteromonadaceae bacterium]|nr:hypothetical protein [Alteromonadaceae bacterium]|tara:strand:+ start:1426 stop:1623 length:198 start_codon:yes stop_codon:yes gene_type:complete
MSNAADALLIIARLLSAMDAAIVLAGNSQKYRELIANAVKEGRDLSQDELEALRTAAQDAIDRLQ